MPCLRLKSIGLLKNEVQVNIREALIRRIRNTAAKKSIKQLVEQQAPFVGEAENV
jgi:hypothetical protein